MSDATLERARQGDEQAFRDLTEPFRRELHVHCYRILASVHDAEDAVQETLVAAWRGLPGFEDRASPRAWLYRIATNRCLNVLRARGRRPPLAPTAPFATPQPTRLGDVTWLQPYPTAQLTAAGGPDTGPEPAARYEATEAIELAFIVALQRLPPRQAAALILRDVLGFSGGEVAAMLRVTETTVKGLLQRARGSVPLPRAEAGSPEPRSAHERTITRRFAEAFAADDIAGVVALLTDDAWLSMPPAPHEYLGPAAIASFLHASASWRTDRHFRLVPTRANEQPAFGCYLPDPARQRAEAAGLVVLSIAGDRVNRITRFLDVGVLDYFGLPPALDLSPPAAGPAL